MITVLGLLMVVLACCLMLAYLQGHLWHGMPTAIACVAFFLVSIFVLGYGLEHETPGGLYYNQVQPATQGDKK